jgi:hypothetical protein
MTITDYTMQIRIDWHQWLFGVVWTRGFAKAFYVGPIAIQLLRVPKLEDFINEIATAGHDFQPIEGELGKYQCADCGEIAVDPALN